MHNELFYYNEQIARNVIIYNNFINIHFLSCKKKLLKSIMNILVNYIAIYNNEYRYSV